MAEPTLFPVTIQERFERYHTKHPEVFNHLVRLAREVKSTGLKRCGISLLWERLRWFYWIECDASEKYRMNDNYRSRFVRLLIDKHPEFKGFFKLRRLRAS